MHSAMDVIAGGECSGLCDDVDGTEEDCTMEQLSKVHTVQSMPE